MPHRPQSAQKGQNKISEDRDTSITKPVGITLSEEEQQILESITRSTSKNPVEINQEIFRFWMAKRQQSTDDTAD